LPPQAEQLTQLLETRRGVEGLDRIIGVLVLVP
jgi:hypothetical protein